MMSLYDKTVTVLAYGHQAERENHPDDLISRITSSVERGQRSHVITFIVYSTSITIIFLNLHEASLVLITFFIVNFVNIMTIEETRSHDFIDCTFIAKKDGIFFYLQFFFSFFNFFIIYFFNVQGSCQRKTNKPQVIQASETSSRLCNGLTPTSDTLEETERG